MDEYWDWFWVSARTLVDHDLCNFVFVCGLIFCANFCPRNSRGVNSIDISDRCKTFERRPVCLSSCFRKSYHRYFWIQFAFRSISVQE